MPKSDVAAFQRKILYLIVFMTLMGLSLGATLTLEQSIQVENSKNGTIIIDDKNGYQKTDHVKLATLCLTISGTVAFVLVQVSWYRYSSENFQC